MTNRVKTLIFAICATFFWSTTFLIGRYLLGGHRIDAYSLVFSRFLIGGILTLIISVFVGDKFRTNWRELWLLLVVAFFLYFGMSVLLFIGQGRCSAIVAAIFLESVPVMIFSVIELIKKRQFDLDKILFMGIALLGCVLILSKGNSIISVSLFGVLALLLSAISWVVGSILLKKVDMKHNMIFKSGITQLMGALLTLPIIFYLSEHNLLIIPRESFELLQVLAMGVFPTALAFIFWNRAINLGELHLALLCQNMTPVFTVIWSILILGEHLSLINVVGIVLVISVLLLSSLVRRKTSKG